MRITSVNDWVVVYDQNFAFTQLRMIPTPKNVGELAVEVNY